MALAKRTPSVLSLFTGCGGLDEGFKAAGFNIVACMELEEWACDTLRENNKDSLIIGPPEYSGDIKALPPKKFVRISGLKKGDIDLIMGGPPCQPFSMAANQRFSKSGENFKRKGFTCEKRGTLLLDFLEYIKFFKPRAFLLENVPGLLTIDDGAQLGMVLKELSNLGYSYTEPRVLNSANFGIPQFRQRLIIWGAKKKDSVTMPEPTHSDEPGLFSSPFKTVAHAIAGMPENLPNSETRNHSAQAIKRYRTLEVGKREHLGRVDRLDPNLPSKTVIAGGKNGGGRSHLHPYIARTLSVRECARLQTFEDDFVLKGSMARQFTQVGNAVPPLLAEKIAREIMRQAFDIEVSGDFKHGRYLHHENELQLSDQLLQESIKAKPDWIYETDSQFSLNNDQKKMA